MSSMRTITDQSKNQIALTLDPLRGRWNSLEPRPRALVLIGAILLGAGFVIAFIWLPASRTRDALTARLPQLEMQLATMRDQAVQLTAIAKVPATTIPTRRVADVAALQSVFGADAQVSAAGDGFRIVIPAIGYASWWDKTSDAMSRHALDILSATLTRIEQPKTSAPVVAVDMRLGVDAGTAVSTATATSTPPGK